MRRTTDRNHARGVVLTAAGASPTLVDDLELSDPRAGEALVEVTLAGVCGSDLAVRDGKVAYPVPVVLGHEAVGVVAAVGSPDETAADAVEAETEQPPRVGDRVVLWMRPPCRACRSCRRGDAALCEQSGVMSARGTLPDGTTGVTRAAAPVHRAFGIGAFAEAVVMPLAGLVVVPAGVPDEVAALSSCGVATGAGAVLNIARPAEGDTVAVWGAGGVGLAAALTARAVGAGGVVVIDPSPERRAGAEALGISAVPGGERAELRAQLLSALGGEPLDVALDAVGRAAVVEQAWRAVRPGGTVVSIGLMGAEERVVLPGPLVPLSQRRLLGCFMGGVDPHRDLPRIFALHGEGRLPIERLVSTLRLLDEVPAALDDLAAARGLRTIIDVQHSGAGQSPGGG